MELCENAILSIQIVVTLPFQLFKVVKFRCFCGIQNKSTKRITFIIIK